MATKATKKKSTRKASPAQVSTVSESPVSADMTLSPGMSRKAMMSPRVMTTLIIVVAIALLTYKFGPWLVPAIADGKPVTRFAIWNRLEKSYGQQALDDMLNETILDSAIAKSGVIVEQSAIDAQIESLNKQFESLGGLDEALKQRGLTRTELEKQVRTQLSVEKVLADKVSVTDEEIRAEFDANKATLYKDQKIEDVKGTIGTSLKDGKLREAFLTWFAEIKEQAKVKNFGL